MPDPKNKNKNLMLIILSSVLLLTLLVLLVGFIFTRPKTTVGFDGERAYRDVKYQVGLGARTPGGSAHSRVRQWIGDELRKSGWSVEEQELESMGHPIFNLIATRGVGKPWVVLGAHFDSRFLADHDPVASNQTQPVPGANDGASGVAVLLELARTLPKDIPGKVSLVFFDAEDNGKIPGWDWILGSTAYVNALQEKPDMAVILDMIGDADLNIHYEKNSDPVISQEIWRTAENLGYGNVFIQTQKYSILDDHTPFLSAGIRAVDIIDFDYPYYHTTQDTPDKVSAESLKAVGNTIHAWLLSIMD